jgi:hypothetical protein
MLNLTNAQKIVLHKSLVALKSNLPDNGRIPLRDKILYALRDLDRYEAGSQGIRHKSVDHVFKALKRYLKETAQ